MALMGRNGMGKSTTVKAICRMLPATGALHFDGQDLTRLPSHKAARLGIGLVPEGRRCFRDLTVLENLIATQQPGHWDVDRVDPGLFPRLGERRSQRAGSLSGGEQQMLAIGRALMTNPRLLILDEATEGLAPTVRQEIWAAITTLKRDAGLGDPGDRQVDEGVARGGGPGGHPGARQDRMGRTDRRPDGGNDGALHRRLNRSTGHSRRLRLRLPGLSIDRRGGLCQQVCKWEEKVTGTVLVEQHDGWCEITLNRPDRLNSFNEEMHGELRDALEGARAAGLRCVLLTGAGRGFCAGQDLSDRDPEAMGGPPDLGETLTTLYNPTLKLIRDLPCPVICAVNGVAAGAGANIALACDMVLAAESARFIQAFAKVGLIPDAGGSWSLPRLIGEARAKALAFTAEPLPAPVAAEWGLIWKSVPDGELMTEARTLAARLAGGATFGLASAKRAIHAAADNTFDEQLELEAELQRACGRSPDYSEGVRAFLEKRDPDFSGEAP